MKRTRWLCALGLVMVFAGAVSAQDEAITATAYQTVNIRSGPDTRYPIVGQVSADDTVVVQGREGDGVGWLYVLLSDGQAGWAPGYLLILEADVDTLPVVEADSEATAEGDGVTVTAYGQVNVRSGPSIGNDIIAQLDVDDTARALARSSAANDWLYIETDEYAGWVAYFTVQVRGQTGGLPIRVPDASGSVLVPPTALIATRFNTRLHADATLESESVGLVPFNSEVTPLARSEDGAWLYVVYGELFGWAVTDLFLISDEQVEQLDVYSPDVDYTLRDDALSDAPTEEAFIFATAEATP